MRIIPALLATLLLASSAHALQIERVTTVTDDNGGSLVISSSGAAFADGGGGTTDLIASDFSPRGDGQIDAELQRQRSRTGDSASSVYNGSAVLSSTDAEGEPVSVTVELVDLTVAREGAGPEFSGTIIINGTPMDASSLPERARGLLARVLRLFAFA